MKHRNHTTALAEGTSPPRARDCLTDRQREFLAYLEELAEDGKHPSYGEIADHFGFESRSAARTHYQALERHGYVEHTPDGYRLTDCTPSWLRDDRVTLTAEALDAAGIPITDVTDPRIKWTDNVRPIPADAVQQLQSCTFVPVNSFEAEE